MRICVLTSVYALSEDDRHASFLVESHARLRARGHEIVVLAPSYHGRKSHLVDGVEVVRFRYFFKRWENLTHGKGAPGRVGNPFYFIMAIPYVLAGMIAAVRLCRRSEFDLVHVQWPFPHAVWGVVLKWFYRRPLVYTFHGAEVLLAQRFVFVGFILRWLLKYADRVTCNSSFTAGKVQKLTSRPVSVIPYGATIEATERRYGKKPSATKNILFAGRLIPRKGLRFLLEAIPLIGPELDVRLDVVGEGPERAICEQLARDLGVSDRVHFHGFVLNEDLEDLYRNTDVFVLPSIVDQNGDTEGLGVVLIEAMSFRKPVIASEVGGIPDVIRDGESGMLVPEKNPTALAAAIRDVLGDDELGNSFGEAGFRRVSEYFDWNRNTDLLESIFREAWEGRAGGSLRED